MDDAEAAAETLAGNTEAFAEIVRRYHRRLYYYVAGKVGSDGEAEDIVQRTLVTAYARLREFDSSQPLLPWLRGIALNHCRNELKAAARQARLKERLLDARRAELEGALLEEPEAADERRISALRECVKNLAESEHTALQMRFVEQLPLKEIGDALRRESEAARLFLFRLRMRLAQCVRKRLALEGDA